MSIMKKTKAKIKPQALDSYMKDKVKLEITGSGDPHEEYAKVRLFLKNISSYDSDLMLFDGDYLAEPAYIKKDIDFSQTKSESIDKLKTLFEVLQESPAQTHLVAGNYEIPGSSKEAVEILGSDIVHDLGCDMSKESKIDRVHEDEEYMGLSTERITWPGVIHEVKGFSFLGVEGSNPINQTFPGERTEENLDWALREPLREKATPSENLIVVTHSPPFGVRDHLGRFGVPPHLWGASKGSISLRNLADEINPFMIMVGHIHESFGMHIKVTSLENPSVTDEVDIDFARRTKVLIGYDTKKLKATITLNKGTLEYWNWSRVRIAEDGGYRVIDIEGEWLERKGTPKPFKKVNRIVNYENTLENTVLAS